MRKRCGRGMKGQVACCDHWWRGEEISTCDLRGFAIRRQRQRVGWGDPPAGREGGSQIGCREK